MEPAKPLTTQRLTSFMHSLPYNEVGPKIYRTLQNMKRKGWVDSFRTTDRDQWVITQLGMTIKQGGKVKMPIKNKRKAKKKTLKVGEAKRTTRKIRGKNRKVIVKRVSKTKYSVRIQGKPKTAKDGDKYGPGNYAGNVRDSKRKSRQKHEVKYRKAKRKGKPKRRR